jgi:hypothetical protein
VSLEVRPISLKEANRWVTEVHRHHGPTVGHKFSTSVVDSETGEIHGVAIAGRPVARGLDDGHTLEVLRVATDGTRNACSMLYGAIRRAAIALGYKPDRIFTYTLESEPGGSLLASGWVRDGRTAGGSWDTPSRRRKDKAPTEPKVRWVAGVVDVRGIY